MYLYIALRKSRILGNFIRLGLFLLQDTPGSTAFDEEYSEYSFYSDQIPCLGREYPEYPGKFPKSSSEMAKFARSVQENPKSLGSDCKCML